MATGLMAILSYFLLWQSAFGERAQAELDDDEEGQSVQARNAKKSSRIGEATVAGTTAAKSPGNGRNTPIDVLVHVAVSAMPTVRMSRAQPPSENQKYTLLRKSREQAAIIRYVDANNRGNSNYTCQKKSCELGHNDCCSMCKIMKATSPGSLCCPIGEGQTLSQRVEEFAHGVIHGRCAETVDSITGKTTLQELITGYYEITQNASREDLLHVFPTQSISYENRGTTCRKFGEYLGPITREALWQVRYEQGPNISSKDVEKLLEEKAKEIIENNLDTLQSHRMSYLNQYFNASSDALPSSLASLSSLSLLQDEEVLGGEPGTRGGSC